METYTDTDDSRNSSSDAHDESVSLDATAIASSRQTRSSSSDSLTQGTPGESEESIETLHEQVEIMGDLVRETSSSNGDDQFDTPGGEAEPGTSESYTVPSWELIGDQEYEESDEYNSIDEWNEEVTAEDVYDRDIDMQGIPWDTLPISRWEKRLQRLHTYENYENLRTSHEGVEKELLPLPSTNGDFYRFKYTRLTEKCSFVHFQLRHLVSASSKNDVFYIHGNHVKHWSSIRRSSRVIMDLSDYNDEVFPSKISTLAARDGIVIVGGFNGEYALISTDTSPQFHFSHFTHALNGIINHIHISHPRSSSATTSPLAFASSNDQHLRTLDLRSFQIIQSIRFDWPVNCSAISPDRRLLAVVGDDTMGLIVDADGHGDVVAKLEGHLDYGFSCAWSIDGRIVATGNQDKTCRLYDIRNSSKPFKVLGASMGAVRSLTFSDDGKFLAMAEPADFVHVFDVASDFSRSQVVDFFGEIAGVSFSPEGGELLYIGNSDPVYGSLLEFERTRPIIYASNFCI